MWSVLRATEKFKVVIHSLFLSRIERARPIFACHYLFYVVTHLPPHNYCSCTVISSMPVSTANCLLSSYLKFSTLLYSAAVSGSIGSRNSLLSSTSPSGITPPASAALPPSGPRTGRHAPFFASSLEGRSNGDAPPSSPFRLFTRTGCRPSSSHAGSSGDGSPFVALQQCAKSTKTFRQRHARTR